jgi:hypothetical protein
MGGASVTGGFGAGGGRGGGFSDAGPMDPPGPVMCGGEVCEPPLSCCIGNSRCFDPESEPEACPVPDPDPNFPDWRPCASSAHCAEGEYCQGLNAWMCQGPGICQSRTNCGGSSYAVCACDGNSYQDIGAACRAGTYATLFYGGACGDTVNANGEGYDPRWVTLCGNDEHCASGERCCPLTMICYPESDPGRCQVPPDGTHYPCTADDQCYPGAEICFGEGCEGPGGCGPLENEECGVRFEPVCGCDGVTYTSADCAMSEGTRVASEGECE